MTNAIVLPIIIHDDSTKMLKSVGVRLNYADMDTIDFAFFNIDYACGIDYDGINYTEIYTGDQCFVAKLTFEDFLNLLENG